MTRLGLGTIFEIYQVPKRLSSLSAKTGEANANFFLKQANFDERLFDIEDEIGGMGYIKSVENKSVDHRYMLGINISVRAYLLERVQLFVP